MGDIINVTGLILQSSPFKEFDRRVEILTREVGRISAFASGARKISGGLSASTLIFTFGEYQLFRGRSSYNINSGEIIRRFDDIADDYETMCYCSYFAEVCRYFTEENISSENELLLMYMTLSAATKGKVPLPLIRLIFEVRMMMLQGEMLEVFRCLRCGRENVNSLYISAGGLVCAECAGKDKNIKDTYPLFLSKDALYTLQYIMTSKPERLYSFNLSDKVYDELKKIIKIYLARYLPHKFTTLRFIDE